MKFLIPLICLLPFFCSCNNKQAEPNSQVKFDKVKWQTKEGEAYPYRDDMLDDLISNITLKGLHYDSVISLLGRPERINDGHLYYRIFRREAGSITLGTKSFVIKLTADSTVEWRKIHGG